MRRIIMLVTVALVMAAMTVATAMPAFAFHAPGHIGLSTTDDKKEAAALCVKVDPSRVGASDCTPGIVKAEGPK